MFIGEYNHAVDDKGRVAIPIKFRDSFGEGAVVTRGLDECLFIYTRTEWQKLADKIAQLPISQANTRAFSRLMLAGAMDLEMDKQGRLILPEYLRHYSGIAKKVVITGLYNRLEIWDEEKWRIYKTGTEKSSTQISENMRDLGI